MRTFNISRTPYEEKQKLYKQSSITIEEGITVLVGCNGCGKSTLLKTIKKCLEDDNTPHLSYDNLYEGTTIAKDRALMNGDINYLASAMISSEGETIKLNLANLARNLGYNILNKHKKAEEFWVLLDAVDSGFSIDNVIELKEELLKFILSNKPDTMKLYILISANEYELVSGEQCFDVYEGKYRTFKSYNSFKNFILRSRVKRDAIEKPTRERKRRRK